MAERRESTYLPKNPLKHYAVEAVALAGVRFDIDGGEYLDVIPDRQKEGKRIVMVGNHLSNADAPLLASAVRRSGHWTLAEKMTFLQGDRLRRYPLIADVESTISVIPPTEKLEPDATEEEKEAYKRRMLATGRAIKERKEKGDIIIVYPEGTRSRDKRLHPGVPGVANYIEGEKDVVIPFAMWGQEEVLPVKGIVPRLGKKVHVAFAEPLSIAAALHYRPRGEEKHRAVDYVMQKVATLLPSSYRGEEFRHNFYEDLYKAS